MREDIIIGEGDSLNSSYKVFDIEGDHNISQNKVSFWIDRCILGIGMTIFKDTEEGRKLQSLIDQKAGLQTITEYLDCVILERMKPEQLRARIVQSIAQSNEEAFEDGQRDKANELLGKFRELKEALYI